MNLRTRLIISWVVEWSNTIFHYSKTWLQPLNSRASRKALSAWAKEKLWSESLALERLRSTPLLYIIIFVLSCVCALATRTSQPASGLPSTTGNWDFPPLAFLYCTCRRYIIPSTLFQSPVHEQQIGISIVDSLMVSFNNPFYTFVYSHLVHSALLIWYKVKGTLSTLEWSAPISKGKHRSGTLHVAFERYRTAPTSGMTKVVLMGQADTHSSLAKRGGTNFITSSCKMGILFTGY